MKKNRMWTIVALIFAAVLMLFWLYFGTWLDDKVEDQPAVLMEITE